MSFKKLILLHFRYCFSKRNLLLIVLSFIIVQIITIFTYLTNKNLNMIDSLKLDLTWQNVFALIKIIYGVIGIFLFGNFCLNENDEYRYLLINKTTKTKYYLAKIIMLDLLIIIILLFNLFCFSIFGIIFNSSFVFNLHYLLSYFYLYLIIVIYANLGVVFIRLSGSIMAIIITLVLYFVSSMEFDLKILKIFLPSLEFDKISLINISMVILTFILYHIISHLVLTDFKK